MLPLPVMDAEVVVGGSAVGAEPGTMEEVVNDVNENEADAVRDIVPKRHYLYSDTPPRDGLREGGAIDRAELQSQHPAGSACRRRTGNWSWSVDIPGPAHARLEISYPYRGR